MRKVFTIVVLLLTFNCRAVFAGECTYQEQANLNSLSSQLKGTYLVKKALLDESKYVGPVPIEYSYLEIQVLNMTPELYLVISNTENDNKRTVRYEDTLDGIYTFKREDISNLVTYSVDVYPTNEECLSKLKKIRNFSIKTPKKNKYSNYDICDGLENFKLCQEFILFDEPSFNVLSKQIAEYKKEDEAIEIDEEQKQGFSFIAWIKEYKMIIIIAVGILVITSGGVAFYKNKNRRRIHEKF